MDGFSRSHPPTVNLFAADAYYSYVSPVPRASAAGNVASSGRRHYGHHGFSEG